MEVYFKERIYDLAQGLRQGFLDQEILPETLYRPFVMSFCLGAAQ